MSTSLSIQGTVTHVGAAEQVTDKLLKCTFAIKTDGDYPKDVAFEAVNAKCELVSKISYDDLVEVHFNVESREWNGKWFTSLRPWKIDVLSNGAGASHSAPPNSVAQDDGDLPF